MDARVSTVSNNGKRRRLSAMELALGKPAAGESRHGTVEGDVIAVRFDGVRLEGKVVKVTRKARCAVVRVTLEFTEKTGDVPVAETALPGEGLA